MNSSLMVFGFLYPNTLFRYYLEPNAMKRVKMTIPSRKDWEDPREIRRL